jgi:hypothetical protein
MIYQPKRAILWFVIAFPFLIAAQISIYWYFEKSYEIQSLIIKTALFCATIALVHTFTKFFAK